MSGRDGTVDREEIIPGGPIPAPGSSNTAQTTTVASSDSALDAAMVEDVVLVAGKGHENYQIVGTEKLPWDDRAALREAWTARGSRT